jgi:gas vesicle protein
MKNPFVKEDNTGLIAAIVIGSLAAGALAYLFLTDSGDAVRGNIRRKAKQKAKDLAAKAVNKKTGISKKIVKKAADHIVE